MGDIADGNLGTPGTKYEADVIEHASIYFLKDDNAVEVTLPLRDRNGEVAAALKTRMKSFPGETRDTAVARATVIKKAVELRMAALRDVTQ